VDGDGDLDLAVGNIAKECAWGSCDWQNRVYENVGGSLLAWATWSSTDWSDTYSVAWGDVDGDGDLDLAAGNRDYWFGGGQPNHVYENDGGTLSPTPAWTSFEADITSSVAWGDMDGDGDLDLAAGNQSGQNRVYRNVMFGPKNLPETPARPHLGRPGTTPAAAGYSTAERLMWPTVIVPFVLKDHESDAAPLVRLQYSRQGGGQWLDATVAGQVTALAASPAGVQHTIVWDVQADAVVGDNVAVRLVVDHQAPSFAGYPLQRPLVSAASATFRVWCPHVAGGCCSATNQLLAAGTPCGDAADTECDNPDTCDGAGNCLDNHEAQGTSCDDGLFCTGEEHCLDGVCESINVPCVGPDGDSNCAESCNEEDDDCSAPDPDGSACSGGKFCAAGVCFEGDPNGEPCTEDIQCKSGYCTDGVCCVVDSCSPHLCGLGGVCEEGDPNGEPCTADIQCKSGHCTDGVCCVVAGSASPGSWAAPPAARSSVPASIASNTSSR